MGQAESSIYNDLEKSSNCQSHLPSLHITCYPETKLILCSLWSGTLSIKETIHEARQGWVWVN
jgi:hypothetical protein